MKKRDYYLFPYTYRISGFPNDKTYNYVYDNMDRVIEISYPNKESEDLEGIKFIYEKAGSKLTKIKATINNSDKLLREYVYDSFGKVSKIKDYYDLTSLGSKYTLKNYSYDKFDNVSKIEFSQSSDKDKILESYTYSYDKNSQIIGTNIINNYSSNKDEHINEERTFKYDNLNRLVEYKSDNKGSTNSAITTSYTYDNIGNRISKDDSTLLKYKYNEFNFLTNILDEEDALVSSYEFDANGNQIKEESEENIIESEYDVLNRLSKTSISSVGQSETLIESEDEGQDDSSSLDASKSLVSVTENLYNGIGKRIKKTVTKANTDNIDLGSDDLDHESTGDAINESTEGLNETVNKEPWVTNTTNYFYQDGVVSYTTNEEGDKTSHNLIGTEDNIISTKRYGNDEGFYSYNKDLQGSITTVLDSEGEFKTGYKYTDFGETTKFGDNEFYNEVCYTGGIYDEETELYYLNARYYDPANSRFLSQDTYRGERLKPDTLHLYAYCSSNPINFVDPSGHWGISIHKGISSWVMRECKSRLKFGKVVYGKIERALRKGSAWPDQQKKGVWKYHGFGEWRSLRTYWRNEAKKEFNKNRYSKAFIYIGIGMHTIQDYYAHHVIYNRKYVTKSKLSKTLLKQYEKFADNAHYDFVNNRWKYRTFVKNNSRYKNARNESKIYFKNFLRSVGR